MGNSIIGVDLGGTQLRAARFDPELNILQREAVPTEAHRGVDHVVARMQDVIARVLPSDRGDVAGVGISAPGPINPRTGIIYNAPNLAGWEDIPLRRLIHEHFGFKTYLGNDANVAALAEATRGAAQGYKYVIYITVSTGIGGGIIDDGHLLIGAQGLGAEVGHIALVVNGQATTLEAEAAGPAIARKAVKRLKAGEESAIRALANNDLNAVSGKTVGDAALQGDALAIDLIREAGFLVGLGIASLMHLFNPQIFVIGGGVTNTGDLLFEPMRQAARTHTLDAAYHENVPIVPAALGDNVALIGAAALVTTDGGSRI